MKTIRWYQIALAVTGYSIVYGFGSLLASYPSFSNLTITRFYVLAVSLTTAIIFLGSLGMEAMDGE